MIQKPLAASSASDNATTRQEQLRERLSHSWAFPERATEGWETGEALEALTGLLRTEMKRSQQTSRRRAFVLPIVLMPLAWLIRGKYFAWTMFFLWEALVAFWWYIEKITSPSQSLLLQQNATMALVGLLERVNEVRLVPKFLEAARQVPYMEKEEDRLAWEQAESEALARLLPRMTVSEAQALLTAQREYLALCLTRGITEDAIVAILLILGSAHEAGATEMATFYLESPAPRVREAARECLRALDAAATKL